MLIALTTQAALCVLADVILDDQSTGDVAYWLELMAAYIADEDTLQGLEKVLDKANPHQKLLNWHGHATATKVFMKAGMPKRAVEALLDTEKQIAKRNARIAYEFLLTSIQIWGDVSRG
jgi:hypothetical protein